MVEESDGILAEIVVAQTQSSRTRQTSSQTPPTSSRKRQRRVRIIEPQAGDTSGHDPALEDVVPAESSSLVSSREMATSVEAPGSVSSDRGPGVTYNFVDNKLLLSKTHVWTLVHDPATQKLLTRVPDATLAEVQAAVESARGAQKSWRQFSFSKRRSMIFQLLEFIRLDASSIAECISREQGKTLDDASTEVLRAADMIEAACSIPAGAAGQHIINESTESHTIHEPLGVCIAITPFNFPFLVPMWSIPFAVITGNTMVVKPSERCPTPIMMLADYFIQAGFPPGVFNVVHGGPTAVDKLLAQPVVRAVSFVGSNAAAERVHEISTATRKRVQAECGGKNHGVVVPDANKVQTLYAIAGSAFGAAGQRCMALSAAVFVGASSDWIPDLVKIAKSLTVGCGLESGVDIGPLISPAAKERVEGLIQSAIDEGATLLLDGRNIRVPGYPNGNFVGPTIITDVQPYMQCYQEEIFGPVLVCMHVATLEDAIEIVNDNRYGNGCSIFTTNPVNAQIFQREVNVGQIGINVPVLASSGQLPRTGNKESFFGETIVQGQNGWQFWTMTKTISSLWRDSR